MSSSPKTDTEDRLAAYTLFCSAVVGRRVTIEGVPRTKKPILTRLLWSDSVHLFCTSLGTLSVSTDDRWLLLLQLFIRNWSDHQDDQLRRAASRTARPLVRRIFFFLEEIRAAHAIIRELPGARFSAELAMAKPTHRESLPGLRHVPALRRAMLSGQSSVPRGDRSQDTYSLNSFLESLAAGACTWRESMICAVSLSADLRVPLALPGQRGLERPSSSGAGPLMTETGVFNAAYAGAMDSAESSDADGRVACRPGMTGTRAPRVSTQTLTQAGTGLAAGVGAGAIGAYLYDEWDCYARAYRPNWCRVVECEASPGDAGRLIPALLAQARIIGPNTTALSRRVQSVPNLHRRSQEGVEICLDGAIEHIIQTRGRRSLDSRPYLAHDRSNPHWAVAVLLDCSASTDMQMARDLAASDPGISSTDDSDGYLWDLGGSASRYQPELPIRQIIDVGREAVGTILMVAGSLGVPAVAYGFGGDGRQNVRLQLVQGFTETWSNRTLRRLAGLRPLGCTRTGAVLRHMTALLDARSEAVKVLLLITDGPPQDEDYGSWNSPEYGIQDARDAWDNLRRRGVSLICATIGTLDEDHDVGFCASSELLKHADAESIVGRLAKILSSGA
jgi:hypothetical protein